MFGRRDFDTDDHSTNLWWVGFIAHGEGWHNGHHAFPWSARHGLLKRQFDASYMLIVLMERLGWVWNVKQPTTADILARQTRHAVDIEIDPTASDNGAVDGAAVTAWIDPSEQDRHEMIKALVFK
jgi:hypothetical protein